MATLIFQRATWRLQVSRTSRNLIISFTTASPQRSNPRHQIAELTSRHSDHHQVRPSRYHQACTAYTSTRAYRSAQQVQQQTSSYPQANTRPSPAAAGTTPSRLPASNNISASPQGPTSSPKDASEYQDLTGGLSDEPIVLDEGDRQVDWARSFHGLSTEAFPKEAADVLLQTITPDDIEVKPDGIIYLPEIKYRRILNRAFGPGGWGLAPRGETIVTAKSVTREYALVVLGRLVSVARGEQDYFSPEGIPTAAEGCKSNALMRCCKDLGVASELWDPRFIRKFMSQHARETFVEHAVTKKRKKVWLRKDDEVKYPFKETKYGS
ncbi:hypothetical protein MMC14_000429 [Varicellaria rhodocarpa]|nr:hypothetical protein [Varicellaria rhodocarpa]